jgi:hypothetical protein
VSGIIGLIFWWEMFFILDESIPLLPTQRNTTSLRYTVYAGKVRSWTNLETLAKIRKFSGDTNNGKVSNILWKHVIENLSLTQIISSAAKPNFRPDSEQNFPISVYEDFV